MRFGKGRNRIVCGNALTLNRVDENGKDTTEPIVFSEWTFPRNDALLQRTDYTFAELLQEDDKTKQQDMFAENDGEGKFLKKYITHYRRLQDNE